MTVEELFSKNQALVHFVFRRYLSSRYMANVYQEDLIQDGMTSLWKCCHSYNKDRGNKFSTYAVPIIKWNMLSTYNTLVKHDTHRVELDSLEGCLEDCSEGISSAKEEILTIMKMLENESARVAQIIKKTIEGYTQCEIAIQCKISQAQVSRELKRFRQKVKSELERRI